MNKAQQWAKDNAQKIALVSREELFEIAFNAGAESEIQRPALDFHGQKITSYTTNIELVLKSEDGFNVPASEDEDNSPELLQTLLSMESTVDIVDWINASTETPCVLELSQGDIVNYSELTNQPGASAQCARLMLAFVKYSKHSIEVIEVIPNGDQ